MKIDFWSSIKSSQIFLMSGHILCEKFYCHLIENVLWTFSAAAFGPNLSYIPTISPSLISKRLTTIFSCQRIFMENIWSVPSDASTQTSVYIVVKKVISKLIFISIPRDVSMKFVLLERWECERRLFNMINLLESFLTVCKSF